MLLAFSSKSPLYSGDSDPILSPLSVGGNMKFRGFTMLFLVLILPLLAPGAHADTTLLGNAEPFAVLAGSTITNTDTTISNRNMGLSPGTSLPGTPLCPAADRFQLTGVINAPNAVALQSQNGLTSA